MGWSEGVGDSSIAMGWREGSSREFKKWWSRQEVMQHIGLIANILWQIWKNRNENEFSESHWYQPIMIIQKARSEWLEQEDGMG